MSVSNSSQQENPWVLILVPHRSLTVAGFYWVLGVLVGTSFIIGLGFCLAGAWPVIGFLGLDVLLVYWALKMSYKTLEHSERIRLTQKELEITSFFGSICRYKAVLQPYWTQVVLILNHENRKRLVVRSHGKEMELGAFLSPDQKSATARKLQDALTDLRNSYIT